MIVIYDKKTGMVESINHIDSTASEEELKRGVKIEGELPKPESITGKMPVMYFDEQKREIYYKYVDRPLTAGEKIDILTAENNGLKEQIALMQQALDEILLNGGAL